MARDGPAVARRRRCSGRAGRDPLTLLAPILMIAAIALVGVGGGGVERLRSLSQVVTGPAAAQLETLSDRADADSALMISWLAGSPLRGEVAAISAERSVSGGENADGGGSSAASTGGSDGDASPTGDGSGGGGTAPATTPTSGSGGGADPGAGGDGSGGVGGVVEDAAGRVNDTVGNARDTVDRAKDAVSDKVDGAADRAGSAIDDARGGIREGVEKTRNDLPVP